jgi:hypothetical protein
MLRGIQLGDNGTDYNHAFALLTLNSITADMDYFDFPLGGQTKNKLGSEHTS